MKRDNVFAVGIVVGIVVLALAAIVGWVLLWGFVAAWLYSSLAPTEWIRPTLWQWVLIVLLFSMVFGGSGASIRSS
jgi:sterol desaturase/sphingolipid hydroxylase (fatty acid hydroxylase superfamily)